MGRGKFMTLDLYRLKNAAFYVAELKLKKQIKKSRVTEMKFKIYIDLWTEIKGQPYLTFLPPINEIDPNPEEQFPKLCSCGRNHATDPDHYNNSSEN